MKKIITAILPFLLVAQIPFHAGNYLPSEWIKSFQYGLKWTELMMNGYPGAEESNEIVPEGEVTTTVVLASAVLQFEDIEIEIEEEPCTHTKEEFEKTTRETLMVLQEMQVEKALEIRTAQVF